MLHTHNTIYTYINTKGNAKTSNANNIQSFQIISLWKLINTSHPISQQFIPTLTLKYNLISHPNPLVNNLETSIVFGNPLDVSNSSLSLTM
ncbi:hypothetical protein FWK35_00011825 [Aphis craccivora]|uniref:Uncharacterized protein n=1 Tax=Aphis craccivora TaxID=307492 RepID=A0A6G0ZAG6_APHCR|nr:hypothetical protein FWK35_00011825 [Aphis craccivora]